MLSIQTMTEICQADIGHLKAGKLPHPNNSTGTSQPVLTLPNNAEHKVVKVITSSLKVSGVTRPRINLESTETEFDALPTKLSGPVGRQRQQMTIPTFWLYC